MMSISSGKDSYMPPEERQNNIIIYDSSLAAILEYATSPMPPLARHAQVSISRDESHHRLKLKSRFKKCHAFAATGLA